MSRKRIEARELASVLSQKSKKHLSEVELRIHLCILLKEMSLENIDFISVHPDFYAIFQHIFSDVMRFEKSLELPSFEVPYFEVILFEKKQKEPINYNSSDQLQMAYKVPKREILHLTCKKNTHYKRELTVGKDYIVNDVIFSETENICVVSDYGQPIEVPISYFE